MNIINHFLKNESKSFVPGTSLWACCTVHANRRNCIMYSQFQEIWVLFWFTDVQSTQNCHLSVLWTLFLVTVVRNWTAPTWFLLAPPPHLSPLDHPVSGAKTPCLPVNPMDSRPALLLTFLGQRETVQTTAISVVCFSLDLLFIWFLVILFCYMHDTILMKVLVFIPWFNLATIRESNDKFL